METLQDLVHRLKSYNSIIHYGNERVSKVNNL